MSGSHRRRAYCFRCGNMFHLLHSNRQTMHLLTGVCLFTVTYHCMHAYLLGAVCTVSAPCTCTDEDIHCESRNLSDIPVGFNSDISTSFISLNFERNNIRTITANAFKTWSPRNSSQIWMLLGFNSIDHIQDGAFKGVSASLQYVDLRSNNLVTIPHALTEINVLEGLRLEGNPISHFDGNTVAVLGTTLRYASLGLENFKAWPHEFHLLRAVVHLGLYRIPFPRLDTDAFHGFENTLLNLSIHHSKLWKIPAAICRLRSLEVILLEDNINLDDATSSVFEPCRVAMPNVKSLELISNNLSYFPDVFNQFPNLTDLRLTGNEIYFIDTKTIPVNISDITATKYQVIYLRLDNNLFTRIPTALTPLGVRSNALSVLSMKSNRIASIEFWDIAFFNLTELYLNGNPLVYITPYIHMTTNLPKNINLRVLRLDNTLMRDIPESIVGFRHLEIFGISGNQIECSCSMSYLKHWNVTALRLLDGVCEYSTETLKHYIENDLQNC